MDLGTCRKVDLFVTNAKYQEVTNFEIIDYVLEYKNPTNYQPDIDKFNKSLEEEIHGIKIDNDGVVTEKEPIDWSAMF